MRSGRFFTLAAEKERNVLFKLGSDDEVKQLHVYVCFVFFTRLNIYFLSDVLFHKRWKIFDKKKRGSVLRL